MALKPGLQPKLSQRLTLSPGLATSLRVLRLTAAELVDETHHLAEENPFITLSQTSAAPVFDPQNLREQESLGAGLIRQLGMMALAPETRAVAEYLTGDLDDRGYLTSDLNELATLLGVPQAQMADGLGALQACEPTGIGARSLAECLQLQLLERNVTLHEAQAVCRALDPLFDGRWREASDLSGLPRARLETLAEIIRSLTPHPAENIADPVATLLPEIEIIEKNPGQYEAVPHDGFLGNMAFDHSLAGMAKGDKTLSQHQRIAQNWVEALTYRRTTLQRIAALLATTQSRFFDGGDSAMIPLTRRTIAGQLSLHPSTIGRAISGKALEHAGTVYRFDRFFSSGVAAKSGEILSSLAIQHRIRALIAAENPADPLSDAEIEQQLSREGVDIARRTVAKYRGCLHLPASFIRKRQKSKG